MENITAFPTPDSHAASDVVVLNCHNQLFFDPSPLVRLFAERDAADAEEIVCRMLEDLAMRLDMLQRARARQAFAKMQRPAVRIGVVADHIGLTEVSVAAGHVCACVGQKDWVALDATMARLERGFDMAVSEVWNFRDF
jgi:hypothetical protein